MLRLTLDIVLHSVVYRHNLSISKSFLTVHEIFTIVACFNVAPSILPPFEFTFPPLILTEFLALSTSSVALRVDHDPAFRYNFPLCKGRTTKPSLGKWILTSIGNLTSSSFRGAITTSSVVNSIRVPIVGLVGD